MGQFCAQENGKKYWMFCRNQGRGSVGKASNEGVNADKAYEYVRRSAMEGSVSDSEGRKDGKEFPARKALSIAGSLTLETALALPWFLFAMLAMLQFAMVQNASSALLAAAQETAKEMAVYAYVRDLGVSAGDGAAAELLTGGLSAVWAKNQILQKSGVTAEDGAVYLLGSSFLQEEMIDLAVSFRSAHTWTLLPVPKQKSLVRARVRAWTGREGSKTGGEEEGGSAEESEEGEVYVTETGTVYHKDPNCTHIHLSIQEVPRSSLNGLRNTSGGCYHACERCGGGSKGTVYVSPYGNKYHSSLECSGLKRTVKKISASEAKGMRACSKCGG